MSDATTPPVPEAYLPADAQTTWKPAVKCDLTTAGGVGFNDAVKKFREWAKEQPRPTITLTTGWNIITQQMAEDLLICNVRNRKMSYPDVLRYGTAMANKRWRKTGEPIIITTRGDVEDAGHRLFACYFSGCSFETYVVTDVPHDDQLFAYIDNGVSRTGEDTLVAAGVNGMSRVLHMTIRNFCLPYDEDALVFHGRMKISPINNVEILDYATAHPDLLAIAHQVQDAYPGAVKRLDSKPGTVFLAWKISAAHGSAVLDEFMNLLTQADLPKGHAVLALQKRLDDHEAAKDAPKRSAKARQKLNDVKIIGMAMRAFNWWLAGNNNVRSITPSLDDPYPRIDPAEVEDEPIAAAAE